MIDKLIGWSLRYRVVVLALAVAFLVWGGFAVRDFPLDVLPDLSAPTVTILVEGRGMAPTEMESLVTFPIEASLNGASGIRRVRSATAVGLAVIWAEFDWGQDILRARQIVTEKLALVNANLPPEVQQPYLAPVSSIMGEIMQIAIPVDPSKISPMAVREYADWVLRPRLLSIPGVAQIIPIGGEVRQFQVQPNTARMSDLGISLDQLESKAPSLVLVVQDLNLKVGHAILAAYVSEKVFILDNQIKPVAPAETIRHYAPMYSVNEESWWLHSPPPK